MKFSGLCFFLMLAQIEIVSTKISFSDTKFLHVQAIKLYLGSVLFDTFNFRDRLFSQDVFSSLFWENVSNRIQTNVNLAGTSGIPRGEFLFLRFITESASCFDRENLNSITIRNNSHLMGAKRLYFGSNSQRCTS